MFDGIARRYDVLNRVLSFGQDVSWRRRALGRLVPGGSVLDVGAGTGDLALAASAAGARPVVALDLAGGMLERARRRPGGERLEYVIASAEALPFADAIFDAVVAGFAVRNFGDLARGASEMRRVLRRGGALAVLEFTQPPNKAFAALYNWYTRHILPIIGGAISGAPDAYNYLPESVRKFPQAPDLAAMMRESGFQNVEWEYLTLGIVALHIGRI